MANNILLIEPSYKNKYPPLGLMKISSYHKRKGDYVVFYKGCLKELASKIWDRIYISTLFTFYWKKTVDTIYFYKSSVNKPSDIFVGGVVASLMKEELEDATGVTVIKGLLNRNGILGYDDEEVIDNITPDYSIVNKETNPLLDYVYPTSNSYLGYATRGCIRNCDFCAVRYIEPEFCNSISILKQVRAIKNKYGKKKHLLLLDNNVLASKKFESIIDDIKKAGFEKGAKFIIEANGKKSISKRYVDFNQGIDAKLLTQENMKLLSEIAINPLRIAFDHIEDKDIYIEKVRLAAEHDIKTLSNYILFNFEDTPEDFYERLRINIDLNIEFERKGYISRIWSFPMKYSPIFGDDCKDRRFIGQNWNKQYLRGIQCILLVTHGVVSPKKMFFERAFGTNVNIFKAIISLPEEYILHRDKHERNGNITKWIRNNHMLDEDDLKIMKKAYTTYKKVKSKKQSSVTIN